MKRYLSLIFFVFLSGCYTVDTPRTPQQKSLNHKALEILATPIIDPEIEDDDSLIVVIVKKGDKQAGLVIDHLLGQQEIVIKPLGKFIRVPKMISGATILGNGEVALIIDSNTLV